MAGADAWGAPEGSTFARHNEGRANVAGNARIIAAPAYRRLLAAEPFLKRSIPILILIFLVVVASVRFLSLMALRDDVERDAKAVLGLAAGELVNALMLAGNDAEAEAQRLIQKTVQSGMLAGSHVIVVTDGTFKVVATTSGAASWQGESLDAIVSGGQPLFMFGDRAGVMDVRIGDRAWYAAVDLTDSRSGAAVAMIPHDTVFAEWRRTVSMNVTLFVVTAGVLLVILYAYFSQAARAQAADRIYLEAHQRVDLARHDPFGELEQVAIVLVDDLGDLAEGQHRLAGLVAKHVVHRTRPVHLAAHHVPVPQATAAAHEREIDPLMRFEVNAVGGLRPRRLAEIGV